MPINCEDSRVWLVAHVRLFHEKKCAERLSKLNIKTYLPLRGELHYWKDRKKRIDFVPLGCFEKSKYQIKVEELWKSEVN